MKIALACEKNQVTQHFGHCEHFVIATVEDGKVISKASYENPGHRPGFLPKYVGELGANVIISGGMGGAAVSLFNEQNIEVVVGHVGEIDALLNEYLNGQLKSTGSVCHEHAHAHECH